MTTLVAPKGKDIKNYEYSHHVIGHPVYKVKDDGRSFQYLIAYCPHDDKADVVRTKSANGLPLFRWRCRTCTKLFAVVSRADVLRTSTPWFELPDDEISYDEYAEEVQRHVRAANERNREKWLQESQQQRNTEQQQRNIEYQQYLQTPAWRLKRDAVMKRDNRLCQGCLKNQATEVHHLTYDRIFDEMLFDLVAICRDCHINKIHKNKVER